ncbi:ArsA family ATPase [Gelria sp. Kuro-4]|uniref:ArsA family ATPase n=1 Tax=Gelria sp. Kuro-4 TaxID=2796927 RepID=UPI001BEFAA6A|nr:ArsA family ATPase [Gelria sp. Kuro-4]BCV24330.1 arsenic transporter ATPase [Gelria sp. Kuro-4]
MAASWWDKKVVFFGGKGGVGKTTCAAAFGLLAAQRGRRTLVVSTDPAHNLGDIFATHIAEEGELAPGLRGYEIDPAKESARYIAEVKQQLQNVVSPVIMEEIERQVEAAYAAPGSEEAAVFDKFIDMLDRLASEFDLVVFDTAPTGHTLRLLSLPELLAAWIDRLIKQREKANRLLSMAAAGAVELKEKAEREDPVLATLKRRRARFTRARAFLVDDQQATFVFVVNAEKLPILETKKALTVLQKNHIPVGGIIVNRLLPDSAGDAFWGRRKELEEEHLAEIEREFRGLILARLPLLPGDVYGRQALDQVVALLDKQV